ncbi:MAG: caspase family protein [Burkholderiales bacterium]
MPKRALRTGLALALTIIAIASVAQSRRAPPVDPIVRVDTPMHQSLIRRLAVDEPRKRLITAGDDKTIRIWQLPDARLVQILRVPIDAGHEGQLFALAVSPDGTRIAAAGWTCWDWGRAGCIYVFDAASGEIVKRVGGLPDAVGALAWSRDGRHLAVGLQGRSGLRVLRTDTFAEIAADRGYEDKVMELAYDARGRLAAVALDGRIRVYRPDHRLHGRIAVEGGKQLATVRYSPDAARIAVGFLDAAAVTVLDSESLAPIVVRRIEAATEQRNLSNVAWSADGAFLYAAGERSVEGPNTLYRWNERGLGPVEPIVIPALRVSELAALENGSIAYSAEDPRIGVVDASGAVVLNRVGELTDFSGGDFALKVATDGATIGFTASDGAERVFSNATNTGQPAGPKPALAGPTRESIGWRIEPSADGRAIHINGQAPRLDDYEIVRTHAFAPAGDALFVGTEWALRRYDRDARERWSVKLAAIVRAVVVSGDGLWVIAALSDGTIRWYRARNGVETLAYFPHANGEDWIAWTQAGYYMSSLQGDKFVGWHVNRGADTTPDFHRAVQFERVLYRPELVTNALRAAARSATRATATSERFDVVRLAEIAPPRLAVRVLGLKTAPDGTARARIRVTGERGAQALRDLTIYVNEIPVTHTSDRAVGWTEASRVARELEVPLSATGNDIRVESFTGVSMGVAETFVGLDTATPVRTAVGDLYVLAIGNNKFPLLPASTTLEYAAQDAEAFAQALGGVARGAFRQVHMQVISDEREKKADRKTVLDALAFTRRARAEDTVIVFLASHGVSDRGGNYWFIPRDATKADLKGAESATPETVPNYPSLISWSAFFEALRDTAGRRLLIVDTCQAKGIEGRFEAFSLMKRSAASRFSLLVAAQANEESQEYPPGKHGLFTYALLQGLTPSADSNRDGQISLAELFAAAAPVVAQLHDRGIGPQTPALIAPPALAASPIAASRALTATR